MKRNIMNIRTSLIAILLMAVSLFTASCSDSDSNGGGQPVITGVRVTDPELADSLFTKSAPGQTIAIIGENLSGTMEIYINDQVVDFNPVFNTDHSIIVSIPSEADGFLLSAYNEGISDEIRVITSHGTAVYAFKVTADYPAISRIKASYPREAGDEALLYGTGLVDVEQLYITDLLPDEVKALVATNQPIGGNHVDVTTYSYKVKENNKVIKNNVTSFDKTTVMAFDIPSVPYETGTLVMEAAGGISYIAYNKYPGIPTVKYLSSDMPVIGETVMLVGNEYVGVRSITYGDVTLDPEDLDIYESEDTIKFVLNQKPSEGSDPHLTLTTLGGSVTVSFYNYTTLLTNFDGMATDNGWGPNAVYEPAKPNVPPYTSDGNYAKIYIDPAGQSWWGTMIYFRYDWDGNSFPLPGFDVIPETATADEIYIAAEVFDNHSSFNNGTFGGYMKTCVMPIGDAVINGTGNYYDYLFSWENYDERLPKFGTTVLGDIRGENPKGEWYRHVIPLSKIPCFTGKNYDQIVKLGINEFGYQFMNQSELHQGIVDVYFDNIRLYYQKKD